MQEYGFYIPVAGLRLRESDPVGLVTLQNLVPKPTHWETPDWPEMLWDETYQIIRGWTKTFLCGATRIYTVNEETKTPTLAHTVPSGGYWHLADFGDAYLLSNGTCTAYRRYTSQGWVSGSTTDPYFGTVIGHYNTRLLYGNLGTGLGNWIGWSDVNADDLSTILAGTSPDAEVIARNTQHVMKAGFRGNVLALVALGEHVIVYGADGIIALTPFETTYREIPVQGLPRDLGIHARHSVAGDNERHIFIGTDGFVWSLGADMKAVRLGYDWIDPNSVVVHDAANRAWWLTGGTETYLLGQHGMGGPISMNVQSLARFADGALVGTGADKRELDYPITVWTNLLSMSDTGQKRITTVRVEADNVSGQRVAAKVRYTRLETMKHMPWFACSPEGACAIGATFVDGQVGYTAKTNGKARVNRVEVRYQSSDRRTVRGTRAVMGAGESNEQ